MWELLNAKGIGTLDPCVVQGSAMVTVFAPRTHNICVADETEVDSKLARNFLRDN